MANSTAVITDAFPGDERDMALGHQLVGGHRRVLHRADCRWPLGRDGPAPHLLRLGSDRAIRHSLGILESPGDRQGRGGPPGLAPAIYCSASLGCLLSGLSMPPALPGCLHELAQTPCARPAYRWCVSTPLWAGVYMLPLTAWFLIAGQASGWLSHRYRARPFATAE
jgi:hypothetical protein